MMRQFLDIRLLKTWQLPDVQFGSTRGSCRVPEQV